MRKDGLKSAAVEWQRKHLNLGLFDSTIQNGLWFLLFSSVLVAECQQVSWLHSVTADRLSNINHVPKTCGGWGGPGVMFIPPPMNFWDSDEVSF